jgi:hypothetical protein
LHAGEPTVCCALAASTANGEFALTPMAIPSAPGMLVTRRLLVPGKGRFLRYFDVYTNTSGVSQTLAASAWTTLASSATFAADVLPSATTGGYFANVDPAAQAASFAVVYAGVNPSVVPQRLLSDDLTTVEPTTTLVVAPGQSVALLHFVALRGPTDVDGAIAAADALTTLQDPDALTGLSVEDRALIVNVRTSP